MLLKYRQLISLNICFTQIASWNIKSFFFSILTLHPTTGINLLAIWKHCVEKSFKVKMETAFFFLLELLFKSVFLLVHNFESPANKYNDFQNPPFRKVQKKNVKYFCIIAWVNDVYKIKWITLSYREPETTFHARPVRRVLCFNSNSVSQT